MTPETTAGPGSVAAQPGGIPAADQAVTPGYRTAAEIASQPQVWRRALPLTGRMADLLGRPGERLLVIGCGTSAFAAESVAALREGWARPTRPTRPSCRLGRPNPAATTGCWR